MLRLSVFFNPVNRSRLLLLNVPEECSLSDQIPEDEVVVIGPAVAFLRQNVVRIHDGVTDAASRRTRGADPKRTPSDSGDQFSVRREGCISANKEDLRVRTSSLSLNQLEPLPKWNYTLRPLLTS